MADYLRHQAAEKAGLNIDTLRYYEKLGLIFPKRSPNGYRIYPEKVIDSLIFIKRAKEAGFTLEEIRKTLLLLECNFNIEELADVMIEGIAAKITEVDVRIQRLLEVREILLEIHHGLKEHHVCQTLQPLLNK